MLRRAGTLLAKQLSQTRSYSNKARSHSGMLPSSLLCVASMPLKRLAGLQWVPCGPPSTSSAFADTFLHVRAFRHAASLQAFSTCSSTLPPFSVSRSSNKCAPCCSGSAARAASGNEIIGIDLGTTNSCVAVMEGKVSVLQLM